MEKLLKQNIIRKNVPSVVSERHIDKFLSLLKNEGDCILYFGARDGCGYGRHQTTMNKKRTTFAAHRLSYQIFVGVIPDGMLVLHSCDKPPCVNPNHLFVGTNKDNARDKMRKGRGKGFSACGEKNKNSKLTLSDVKTARHLYFAEARRISEIADFYKVSWDTMKRAVRGITWNLDKWKW